MTRPRPMHGSPKAEHVVVDGHVHVALEKYRPLVEYSADMDAAAVDRAVLVQHVGHWDNAYLVAAVRMDPGRYACVAMADLDSPTWDETVADLATNEHVVGLRLSASARSPGRDPFAVWRALADGGLVASVRGPLSDIVNAEFAEILQELPHLKVRLEHLGFFRFGVDVDPDFDRLLAYSHHTNVWTMWSGFYEFSGAPFPHEDALPYLRASLDAYGSSRIMLGGDWNRNDLDPGHPANYYRQWPSIIDHLTLQFSYEGCRNDIIGGTARALFWPTEDRA